MDEKPELEKWMYCYDCKKCTNQKLRNSNYDGKPLYLCKECGCENSLDDDDKCIE